ncbi:hypothetical protein N656DRAFT_34216 [Canariomyces notabilis]|uniref:Uncharacterized protein n=1 Tax=Canariomyces notabilis TaxID=2074819 RepID=A0AAN6YXI0_9PEZI|nr:hypothetical protein N656DRAFT_34216 [Canariomyces arenarius]
MFCPCWPSHDIRVRKNHLQVGAFALFLVLGWRLSRRKGVGKGAGWRYGAGRGGRGFPNQRWPRPRASSAVIVGLFLVWENYDMHSGGDTIT